MNDDFDVSALVVGTSTVAAGAFFLDLNVILSVVVGSIVFAALAYRRKHRHERFPRSKKGKNDE